MVGLFVALCFPLAAKVSLPPVVGDNMVLQQESDAPLWGWSDSGKRVTVKTSWDRKKYRAGLDPVTGKWSVSVRTPSAGGPYEITVDDGDKTVIRNVLVGEVWYCSGQSNMEMPVKGFGSLPVEGGAEAVMYAKASRPIRICSIPHQASLKEESLCEGGWKEAGPETVASTSAVAWFFADAIQRSLDIPVGIVVSTWSGSRIESWLSREVIDSLFTGITDTGHLDGTRPVKTERHEACMLYNGQVAPLVPYLFRGIIWYQGESNRFRSRIYPAQQKAYVEMMREKFNPDASFYFVQVAPCGLGRPDDTDNARLMEAQQRSLDVMEGRCGMVTTCDLGHVSNIHPPLKKPVGERLAMLALSKDYGFGFLDAEAPVYEKVEFADGKAVVTFRCGPAGLAPSEDDLEGFCLAGEDRVFHKAVARVSGGNKVVVSSPEVPAPVAVRYCFTNYSKGSLFNGYGVPAAPFRSDDWDR